MPNLPLPLITRPPLDRRVRVTSSLSNPRALLASVFLLWVGMGRPGVLDYADPASDGETELKIDSGVLSRTQTTWRKYGSLPANFKGLLEGSPLFSIQMEPLQVALELVWNLCQITFVDSKNSSAERTDKVRFRKILNFTVAMDLLNELLTDLNNGFSPDVLNLLLHWLDNKSFPGAYENKLVKVLAVLSEDAHFAIKVKAKNQLIEFQQEGIYKALGDGSAVYFGADEIKGPLRILNKVVKDGLHPFLTATSSEINIGKDVGGFADYAQRVSHYLNVIARPSTSITIVSEESPSETDAKDALEGVEGFPPTSTGETGKAPSSPFPWNWIVYGAPGTGKSHFLDEKRKELKPKDVKRVIFHSDYTYAQFVGGYRPAPIYEPDTAKGDKEYKTLAGADELRPGRPVIEYGFIPGPLIEILVAAQNDRENHYLLIIEELNRADAPAVFGDIFQLLDREANGESKYPVRLSKEACEYLQAKGLGPDIRLPSNLSIWATMNNADQGVMPLDTAFKRRWQFEYIGIDQGAAVVDSLEIPTKFLSDAGTPRNIKWNEVRRQINDKLRELRIHEDMHIGPFFLNESELTTDKAFKFKLLAYLRDDILRHRADEFFNLPGATLSDLLAKYEKGENIFHFTLK